jgi:ComF family protein
MLKVILKIGGDIFDLLYPVSCLVCGDRLNDQRHLCSYCLRHAFVPTNEEGRESSQGLVLPEWVAMQESLWEFDKGGFLQDVLHHVKYSGLADLAVALGEELGYKLLGNRFLTVSSDVVLLPVPLHPYRQRKRGYNQSVLIAGGISNVTGAQVAPGRAVRRIRNTRTQTGLNASSRRKNLSGAFELVDADLFRGRDVIVVDDVITTGATVFELSGQVRGQCCRIGVATVARA